MEGTGGRGRRNDSISSVMSVGADNTSPSWADDNNNNARADQRSSRAEQQLDHEASVHMLSQYAPEEPSYMDASTSSDTEQSDMMSPLEIRHAIFELLEELPETAAVDLITPYQRAAMLPPVTQESLCELDVGRIINNPKLRHDVNFDRELHFRPNLDGTRGKQKLKSADEYWKALLAELEIYRAVGFRLMTSRSAEELEYWTCMIKANQIRLPGVFSTIHEILKTLVPERDQAIVAERLDVDMIMQQICKGVFDLLDLAQWLATILKAHCAPMRDEWIDQMVEQTTKGVQEGDQKAVVVGLRQTLAILEAMKLDVANHQIRHLRSLLIDDTVNFQQKYHIHKIAGNRFKLDGARNWFKEEQTLLNGCNLAPTPLETFSSAVLRSLLAQSNLTHFPDTFHLDYERLRLIRSDVHNMIQMNMCCNAFDILIKDKADEQARAAAKKSLQANIAAIVSDARLYLENLENISAEIVRFVLQLEGADVTFDSDMMSIVEHHLRAELPLGSSAFGTQLQTILDTQLPRLCNAVKSSSRLPILALHDLMLPPIQPVGKRAPAKAVAEPLLDEILKRITHLTVIHWHVWSPIVYDVQIEAELSPLGSPGNNPDASHMNTNTASPSSGASTPEMQSQNGAFTQPPGPSITNGRSPK
ncbi:Tcp11-domain-containing protein, partial [Aureobasidium melanogenum]